jgi:hypothetical protein
MALDLPGHGSGIGVDGNLLCPLARDNQGPRYGKGAFPQAKGGMGRKRSGPKCHTGPERAKENNP